MKENKKIVLNIIIIVLGIIFIYSGYTVFKKDNGEFNNEQRECLFEKTILQVVLKTNISYEDTKLKNAQLLDKHNKSIHLKSIMDSLPCLFLYVPMQGCEKCVDDIIVLIKEFSDTNKIHKVKILVRSPNFRSFLAVYGNNGINIEAFYVQEELGLKLEQFDTPFLFLSDSSLYTDHFFLLDKNIPEINQFYIEKVFSLVSDVEERK
ncbi:MAG TPA: hypothetical protein P5132_00775 [Bacteroidales bacterium]|nr:hypothetical protein [Bacteroidales bacterium]